MPSRPRPGRSRRRASRRASPRPCPSSSSARRPGGAQSGRRRGPRTARRRSRRNPMTFASSDAFPARGGIGDESRQFVSDTFEGVRHHSDYVELHAHSAYSFLDGASLPEELAARAAELGYDALALTDHDGVYGSLEFANAAKHFGLRAITGAEVSLAGGAHVTLLCESQRGYGNLCRILTDGHAQTRLHGRERDLLPPETSIGVLEEHAEG